MAKHRNALYDPYGQRVERDRIEQLAGEARAYHSGLATGLSYEEALIEIGRTRAFVENREKVDAEIADLRRIARGIQVDHDRLMRIRNEVPVKHYDTPPRLPEPQPVSYDHPPLDFDNMELPPWEDTPWEGEQVAAVPASVH